MQLPDGTRREGIFENNKFIGDGKKSEPIESREVEEAKGIEGQVDEQGQQPAKEWP